MKKYIIIFLLLFFLYNTNYSQVTSSYIFIGTGPSVPVIGKSFSATYSTGPNLTGGIGLSFSKNVIAKAELGYNHFYLKNNINVSGLTILSYLLNLNIGNFSSKGITPFGIAGLGAFTLSDFISSQTNIGFNIGFGVSGSYKNNIIPFGDIQLNYNLNSGPAKGYTRFQAGVLFSL